MNEGESAYEHTKAINAAIERSTVKVCDRCGSRIETGRKCCEAFKLAVEMMKSEDITFWQVIKHWFGYHVYGKRMFPPDRDEDYNAVRGSYRRCKICSKYEI